MAKQSRNTPCICGSGRKFKHCCGRSNVDLVTTESGGLKRVFHNPELAEDLRQLLKAREAVQGRPLHPDDHVFPELQPENWEQRKRDVMGDFQRAGVPLYLAYAFLKTGMLVIQGREDEWTPESLREFYAACDEYTPGKEKELPPPSNEGPRVGLELRP